MAVRILLLRILWQVESEVIDTCSNDTCEARSEECDVIGHWIVVVDGLMLLSKFSKHSVFRKTRRLEEKRITRLASLALQD